MTSAFWRGQGPEPGVPLRLTREIRGGSQGIKIIHNGSAFNLKEWGAFVRREQRLQWMENAYQSPDVLKYAEKAAQEPLGDISWTGDPDWLPPFEIKTSSQPWSEMTSQQILDQLEAYLRPFLKKD